MRACALLPLVLSCGGNLGPSGDAAPMPSPDAGRFFDDAAGFVPGTDAGPDADPVPMPTPSGSILALALNQSGWAVVRITLPGASVTPLFTFQPQNLYQPHAIAQRPDGDIDRFDYEGGKTHVFRVSKGTGAPIGQERVIEGMVRGADYGPDGKLWAGWYTMGNGGRIVTIDANGNLTPIAPSRIVDVGLVANVVATLECRCAEDLFNGAIGSFSVTGTNLGDIASDLRVWDAMTPMGSYLVVVDDSGRVKVLDPVTKLWSVELKTAWHFKDATEDQ